LGAIAELEEDAGGNVNAAFDTMARALACEPSSEQTLQSLMRLATATGRFGDLAEIVAKQASVVEDAELASSLYMSAARVLEESVGDAARAIDLYKKVLAADPTNVEAAESLQ